MNFGELRAMVADWCHRSNMTSVIPSCITLATAQFNRVLRTPEMESRDSRSITTEFASLPPDFLEIISVVRDDGKEIRYVARPNLASHIAAGEEPEPPIYSIEDYQFRFLPAPSVSEPLDVSILYFEQIAALEDDSDENWLLTAYPDAYLYGALMHARAWLQDDARVALIKPMYEQAIAQISQRKVAAPGVASVMQTDIPLGISRYDITRGY
jgi:hypothetical protein